MTYYGFVNDMVENEEERKPKQNQYSKGYEDGYTKAIDDFVDKVEFVVGAEDRDIYCKEIVKEVAEQLKAGGSDG